jgi:UDP-N-acetylglucosamine 1-carboxyvinyltransferase
MTQAQFARMLATSQSAVNRIEHGKQNLSLNTLQRISKVLKYEFISLNEFGQPKANVSQDPESGGFVIRLDPS